jgi:ribosomal protein S18 acetylase RimI-like enzyme
MRAGSPDLDPGLIGQRLTLRLHDPEGGYRDLVGILESATTIRKRSGEIVEFDPRQIAIVHPIKDVPQRAGSGAPLSLRIAELEALSTRTWPPREIKEIGKWQVRISDGVTYRANSVLVSGAPPFGEPGIELDQAIDLVEKIYTDAQLPAVFHLVHPIYQEFTDYLIGKGWTEKVGAAFLVCDIDSTREITDTLKERNLTLLNEEAPTPEFLALHSDEILESIMNSYPARYLSLRSDGVTVATARLAVCESWAITTRLIVAESHRRQGLAELLMQAATTLSHADGANKMCLQLDRSNIAAQALYEKMGFRVHHTYSFIERENRSECAC